MKTLNWVILLVLGLSLTSMTARPSFVGKEENNVERFMNADTIKYILFRSETDMKNSVFRSCVSDGDITGFAFFNESLAEGTIIFTTKFEAPSVTKSKAFLDSITYMNWDVVKESLTKEEGKKLREYFLDRCGRRALYPHKKVQLYFIDKRDFVGDSIKVFKVHCMTFKHGNML